MTETFTCWSCKKGIEAQDCYCRFCGKGQGRFVKWYYKHWGIILLTLFALGPFSLPLVWRSPVISGTAKKVYTLAILLLTVYIAQKTYSLYMSIQALLANMQF